MKKTYAVYPLYTQILKPQDDLLRIVVEYTKNIVAPGDVIALAETVVAITQGRAILPADVQVSPLARFLSLFPRKDGSLATPEAMQIAIEEVGRMKIILGAGAALCGKMIGKKGFFYLVAGRDLARIDDVARTMWPFEEYIVLGPRDPGKLVGDIKEKTGAEAAIVDVNDAYRVDILAATEGVDFQDLVESLLDNPFGNEDQQTPFVILKKRQ
ncbi:MAG: F420-0:Gamma-glutamyl ligase [Firmicutes bacterium]|nr:F420-0:Gamma-glutamyl ligase [Bacillota bacterium]